MVFSGCLPPSVQPAARDAVLSFSAAYFCWPVKPGLIHATVNFAQAAKEAGVSTIINLSQRSANRDSTSDSCRDSFIAQLVGPLSFISVRLMPLNGSSTRDSPYLQQGVLRMPVSKGRDSPIAADDQGPRHRGAAEEPPGAIGKTTPLSGPVEMRSERSCL
jgi:NAD(P)H dehydrogenase (quinone)